MTYIVDGNNSSAVLSTSLTNVSSSIALTSKVNWPTITSPQVIRATITSPSGQREIIDIDDADNITRAREGTSAQAFIAGSIVQINQTAGKLQEKQNRIANADDVINFGDAVSLEIPNSASPSVTVNGQIALDNTVTDFAGGLVVYRSGGVNYGLIAVPLADLASPTDTYVLTYDAGADKFKLAAGGGGGGGSGDVVGPASAVDATPVLYDGTTGKLIKSLADPGADRILFWDDSASTSDWLTLGTNLSITGTTLNASGGGSPGGSNTQVQYNNSGSFAGDSGFTRNGTGDYTMSSSLTVNGVNLQSNTVSAVGTNVNLTLAGSSSTQTVIISGTAAIQIPNGSTAQRPSASTGNLRLNTSTFNLEMGAGGSWYPILSDINFGTAGIMQCTGAGAYSVLSSVAVALGGTGRTTSTTAYGVICAGTTATGALQTLSSLGTLGQSLKSTGAGALPAFSGALGYVAVSRTSTQSINGSTYTKLQLNVETSDVDNAFDNVTNYRHTPTKAGKWLYISCVSVSGILTTEYLINAIYKNGADVGETIGIGFSNMWVQQTAMLDMNGTTDYVELYLYHNHATAVNTQGAGSVNYLFGILLS